MCLSKPCLSKRECTVYGNGHLNLFDDVLSNHDIARQGFYLKKYKVKVLK